MKKYISLLDDIVVNLLGDLKSLRVWLIIAGFTFNGAVIYLIAFHGLAASIGLASIGLLTAIYTFFFASKRDQAATENAQDPEDNDVPVDRDPSK